MNPNLANGFSAILKGLISNALGSVFLVLAVFTFFLGIGFFLGRE